MDAELARLARFFETLTESSVANLGEYYADDAYFKDPFNEVRGLPAIRRIFAHMFVQVEQPRFVVTGRFCGTDGGMLLWKFHCRTRGLRGIGARRVCIRGASHVRCGGDGRVIWHRDYWDAAEELYARLPLLGPFMRVLQRAGGA